MLKQLPKTHSEAPLDYPRRKFWGLIKRKERWGLSWWGRLLVGSIVLVGVGLTILNVHQFLAVTNRVNTRVLVVEGWVHRYAILAAANEFKQGPYMWVYTTGGPENGSGGYVNDYQTSASVGADGLKKAGIAEQLVYMAPSHVIGQERTYSSAITLRDWFREHNIPVQSMNIVTEDCHARRTRLLFRKAFGKDVRVGIVAVPNPDYDSKYWWRYSDGVREVIGESIAYLYARFLFYPPVSPSDRSVAGTSQHSSGNRQ